MLFVVRFTILFFHLLREFCVIFININSRIHPIWVVYKNTSLYLLYVLLMVYRTRVRIGLEFLTFLDKLREKTKVNNDLV